MCTPSTSDRRSIRQSAHGLLVASSAFVRALGVLLYALLTAPGRLRRHVRPRPRPASVGGIDIQVHLEDQRCIANLRRVLQSTLRRAAATWAPMALPVHRVVVGAGFPAEGKADIYDSFSRVGDDRTSDRDAGRLIVISLGLRTGDRDLEPFELAGVLAVQIQRVVDDVHRAHARVAVDAAAVAVAASSPSRLSRPAAELVVPRTDDARSAPDHVAAASLPRLQELLATVQEGQPLVAAGPNSQTANP